ncbi:hypothetical protein KR018_000360 [Drosophila ironensis]|nr:hypothetical protein KR018_000360 [Drosophila ironensis]
MTEAPDPKTESDDDDETDMMNINISFRSHKDDIVLNDLLLMNLVCQHPYIVNTTTEYYLTKGWERITKAFNKAYTDAGLDITFASEVLQWRWHDLKAFVPLLMKIHDQVPADLRPVVARTHELLTDPNPGRGKNSYIRHMLMSQVPLVESLNTKQRHRLQMEIMHLILQQERAEKATHVLTPEDMAAIDKRYKEFLKKIRVKELLPDGRNASQPPVVKEEVKKEDPAANAAPSPSDQYVDSEDDSDNEFEIPLKMLPDVPPEVRAAFPPDRLAEIIANAMAVKKQYAQNDEGQADYENQEPVVLPPLQVPPECFKFFIRKCRVMLKRLDMKKALQKQTFRRCRRLKTHF